MLSTKRYNYKLIEAELYNYRHTKKLLDSLLEESNTKKMPSAVIAELSNRVEAIEYALKKCKRNNQTIKCDLVEMKYFELFHSNKEIMNKLYISKATFFNYQRDFIRIVAERLGWMI